MVEGLNLTPAGGATALSEVTDIMKGRYTALPEQYHPHIIMNAFGKGKSLYIPGNAGEYFSDTTNPDWKRIIANCVNRLSAPVITTDAPGSVEVVVRRQKNRFIIHFINLTGEMERPIQRIIPIRNVTARLHTKRKIKTAFSLTGKVAFNAATRELKLPVLKDYEVIVL